MRNPTSCLLLSLFLLGACQTPSADYSFVFIRTGPAQGLSREETQRAVNGHFSNMKKMAEAGDLIVAGPLGEPRVAPDHRGIFVFDTGDHARALELANTDPAAQAGIFVFDVHPWQASPALRRVPALDAALAADLPENAGPGATARPFVLVRCADADAAERALAPLFADGAVLFFGRLTDESPVGALFALDAMDLDGARALLERAGDTPDGFWTLHPWFASKALLDLPGLSE